MRNEKRNFKKFVATAALATITASAIVPSVSAATTFTDVNARLKDAVDYVVSKGAQGYSETQFGSYDSIKRVDAAVILAKVLELDVENAPATCFTDVPKRAEKYVNALYEAGITMGKRNKQFGSNDFITRGEIAVWLRKAYNLKSGQEMPFTDVPKSIIDSVSALVNHKITDGLIPTQFGTYEEINRGDYAVFLYRALKVVDDEEIDPEFSVEREFLLDTSFDNTHFDDRMVLNNGIVTDSFENGRFFVKFDQPYDVETATNPDNYTVNSQKSVAVEAIDETMLIVTTAFETLPKDQRYDVTIANVKSAEGVTLEDYHTQEFFFENVRPSLVEAQMLNDQQIKITFSEPINAQRNVKDGLVVSLGEGLGTVAIDNVQAADGVNSVDELTLIITLSKQLSSEELEVGVTVETVEVYNTVEDRKGNPAKASFVKVSS